MGEVKDLLVILISSSLVSNVVLSQFLGLCPFLGVSKKINTAAGMGGAIIFVITLSSAIASNLAKGYGLAEAVERAKTYLSGALGAMLDLGRGPGPMNHAFDIKPAYRKTAD